MKARTKTYIMYSITTFSGDAEVMIHCFPQQKWDVIEQGTNHVRVSRKNITFMMPREDFEQQWKVVEQK